MPGALPPPGLAGPRLLRQPPSSRPPCLRGPAASAAERCCAPRLLPLLQWRSSMMDGCGVKITKQSGSTTYLAEEGEFVNDEWVSRCSCSLPALRCCRLSPLFGAREMACVPAWACSEGAQVCTGLPPRLQQHSMRAAPGAVQPLLRPSGSCLCDMAAALKLLLPHVQVGSAMACTVEQARAAAAEADRAAQMARVFEVRCCTVNSKLAYADDHQPLCLPCVQVGGWQIGF